MSWSLVTNYCVVIRSVSRVSQHRRFNIHSCHLFTNRTEWLWQEFVVPRDRWTVAVGRWTSVEAAVRLDFVRATETVLGHWHVARQPHLSTQRRANARCWCHWYAVVSLFL